MIRRATAEDADAIAELYERSFATLAFLPVLHTLDEHRRTDGSGNEEGTPDVLYEWRPEAAGGQ